MAIFMLLAAYFVGMDAADALGKTDPLPVAYFEAAMCCVLVLGAVVLIALGRGDEQ